MEEEEEVLPTCRELSIGFVSYSPLGRGFLTGRWRSVEDLPEGDTRVARFPRFSEENFKKNLEMADEKGAIPRASWPSRVCLRRATTSSPSPAPSVASAWRRARRRWRSSQPKGISRASRTLPRGSASGERFYEQQMRAVNR